MGSLIGTVMLLAQAMPALSGCDAPAPGCCDVCGVRTAELAGLICQLQRSPEWRLRKQAAHRLRQFEWTCHPEAALALAGALLTDCDADVRKEAAQSLGKLAPCLPPVHEALARSVRCERNPCTRLWARNALRKLGRRCRGACLVCQDSGPGVGPGPGLVLPPVGLIDPMGVPGGPPGGAIAPPVGPAVPAPGLVAPPEGRPPSGVPPTEVPPPLAPPGPAPFQVGPTSAARDDPPPEPVPATARRGGWPLQRLGRDVLGDTRS